MRRFTVLLVLTICVFSSGCGEKSRATGEANDGRVSERQKSAKAEDEKETSQVGEPNEKKAGGVELSPAAQRRMGLVVAPAEVTPLADVLTLTGAVQPIDSRVSRLRPLARGRVTDVLVRLGDQVNSGQVLARFDNIEAGELTSQYNTAQAELARLRIQQAVTARQAERSRNLAAIGAVPQKELEAIEAERQGQQEAIRAQESTLAGLATRLERFGVTELGSATSSMTAIQAPFAGVVTSIQAAPGEVVDAASELFSVADLSRVYVTGQVYEKDLGRVQVGQSATILAAAYPDLRFAGRVASISAVLDPQTRTAAVRVEVMNSGERLRLDMFASVELPTATKRKVLAVPTEAIQQVEGRPTVFLRQDATHFSARSIQVGTTIGGLTEVTEGLVAGETVVTKGAFQVKSSLLSSELGEKE